MGIIINHDKRIPFLKNPYFKESKAGHLSHPTHSSIAHFSHPMKEMKEIKHVFSQDES